jgi:hypothetical protein
MVKKKIDIPILDDNADQIISDIVVDEINVTEDEDEKKDMVWALKQYGTFVEKVKKLKKVM